MTLMNCRRSPVFRAGPGRGVSIEGTALVEYFSIREGGSPFLWLHDSKGIAPIFFERPLRVRSRFGLGNLDGRQVSMPNSPHFNPPDSIRSADCCEPARDSRPCRDCPLGC